MLPAGKGRGLSWTAPVPGGAFLSVGPTSQDHWWYTAFGGLPDGLLAGPPTLGDAQLLNGQKLWQNRDALARATTPAG